MLPVPGDDVRGAMAVDGSWTHFPHGADVGLAGTGTTKAEAFRQTALALTAVVTDPAGVRPLQQVEVRCEAPSDDLLLVEWLNAIIFEMSVGKMVFGDYRVDIADGRLHATAFGEAVDPVRHEPAVEVKGATLTALRVSQDGGRWHAQCVVDV